MTSSGMRQTADRAGAMTTAALAEPTGTLYHSLTPITSALVILAAVGEMDGSVEKRRAALATAVRYTPWGLRGAAETVARVGAPAAVAASRVLSPVVSAIWAVSFAHASCQSLLAVREIRNRMDQENLPGDSGRNGQALRSYLLAQRDAGREMAQAVHNGLMALGCLAAFVGNSTALFDWNAPLDPALGMSMFIVMAAGSVTIRLYMLFDEERASVAGEARKLPHQINGLRAGRREEAQAAMAAIDADVKRKRLAHQFGCGVDDLPKDLGKISD